MINNGEIKANFVKFSRQCIEKVVSLFTYRFSLGPQSFSWYFSEHSKFQYQSLSSLMFSNHLLSIKAIFHWVSLHFSWRWHSYLTFGFMSTWSLNWVTAHTIRWTFSFLFMWSRFLQGKILSGFTAQPAHITFGSRAP